jgi:hypothetical protein
MRGFHASPFPCSTSPFGPLRAMADMIKERLKR